MDAPQKIRTDPRHQHMNAPTQSAFIPTAGERSGHCADCPFFDVIEGQASDGTVAPPTWGGICRANPPRETITAPPEIQGAGISIGQRAIWPLVAVSDFCGKHPLRIAAYNEAVVELTKVVREKVQEDRHARREAARKAKRSLQT